MKHLFLVHSPITYLTSVSVINKLGLSKDAAVIIFFEFNKILSAEKYASVSIDDFFSNKTSLKKIYNYFRYFNVINRFDILVNSITDNKKFIAYVPVLLFAGKAIITNTNCVAFNFIEEGLLNYYTEDTLKSITVVRSKNPWRSSILKKTKLVLSEMFEVLRGYNFKLQALPFSYSCYQAFNNVFYYGLSSNSFPLAHAEKRIVVEFQKQSFSNIEQKLSFNLNDSVIWIGDGGVTQHGLNEKIYLKGIEAGCIPFIQQQQHKKCFIKFHRDETPALREAVKNLFAKNNIQFEVIPDSVVMELLLFKASNAMLIGVYSSLLYYASIINHSAFSIYNFLKSEYAQIIAERDFTFFWNKVKLIGTNDKVTA